MNHLNQPLIFRGFARPLVSGWYLRCNHFLQHQKPRVFNSGTGPKSYVKNNQVIELLESTDKKIDAKIPFSLPETNMFAPENGWLEYFLVSVWDGLFSGANC